MKALGNVAHDSIRESTGPGEACPERSRRGRAGGGFDSAGNPAGNRYHFPDGSDVPALQRAGGPGRLLRATGERGPPCLPSVLGAALPGPASGLADPPAPPARSDASSLPPHSFLTSLPYSHSYSSFFRYIFMHELHI